MAHNNNDTISTISKGGYRVEGKVGEVPISFLLDTGAAVTLLRKDTWERVSAGNQLRLSPWEGERLVGVDGSPLQVFGQVKVGTELIWKGTPSPYPCSESTNLTGHSRAGLLARACGHD